MGFFLLINPKFYWKYIDFEKKYNDPNIKKIVLFNDKKKKIIKPEVNIDLEITYLVKEIGSHYTF